MHPSMVCIAPEVHIRIKHSKVDQRRHLRSSTRKITDNLNDLQDNRHLRAIAVFQQRN